MLPYLFEIGPLKIGTYGLCLLLGFVAGYYVLHRELRLRGLDPTPAYPVIVGAAISGVIGARICSIFERWDTFTADPWGTVFSQGGLTWYGGFIVAYVVVLITLRKHGSPMGRAHDALAPALIVGYSFGRLGCQISGDGCYGIPSDLPWAMAYAKGIVPTAVRVHPTPIYEILNMAALVPLFMWLRNWKLRPGALFFLYLALTGASRFWVEIIRRNDRFCLDQSPWRWIEGKEWLERQAAHGALDLTLSQWIAVGMMLVGFSVVAAAAIERVRAARRSA